MCSCAPMDEPPLAARHGKVISKLIFQKKVDGKCVNIQ